MYILEGNIGSGKSTFLTLLSQYMPRIKIVLEPVNSWKKKVYGQSLLKNFYQDPSRWAYTFETLTLKNRVKEHLKEQADNQPKIIERSIYSGYYCFAQNSYQQGFMSQLEWSLYKEWFSFLVPGICKPPYGFIYLRTIPKIAYRRIKNRNRDTETNISFDYVQQIHQRNEDLLLNKKNMLPELKNIPILVLNCNEEFETNSLLFDQLVNQIEKFMQSSPSSRVQSNILTESTP